MSLGAWNVVISVPGGVQPGGAGESPARRLSGRRPRSLGESSARDAANGRPRLLAQEQPDVAAGIVFRRTVAIAYQQVELAVTVPVGDVDPATVTLVVLLGVEE